jgi:hypothetical protein
MAGIVGVIGSLCAVAGAIISVVGALTNNLQHDHRKAMKFWMVSNILLLMWSAGYLLGYWNGSLSIGALFVMYLIFTVSNFYGLSIGTEE